MTEPAVYRPATRPSPGPTAAGTLLAENTHATITDSDSQLSSGDLDSAPTERGWGRKLSTLHQRLHPAMITVRDRLRVAVAQSRAYWVPPKLLTEPPTSVADLVAYARRGGWTRSPYYPPGTVRKDPVTGKDQVMKSGPVRRLGLLWFALVALPWAVVCRYAAWLAERPGRWVAAFFIWQAVIRSGPGCWFADHIIRPILATGAWIFLP